MEQEQKWTEYIWMNYRGRVVGTAGGLFLGFIFLIVGFWKTLFFTFIVTVGFMIGMQWDGRINIKEWLDALLFDRWMRK